MFLPIFSIAIGLFFAVCGVRIVFFHHYQLISDYTPAKGDGYGRRVGMIQLAFGCLFIASGALGLYLLIDAYSYLSLFTLFGGYIGAMNLASKGK
mgnify:CR=1 FL=1